LLICYPGNVAAGQVKERSILSPHPGQILRCSAALQHLPSNDDHLGRTGPASLTRLPVRSSSALSTTLRLAASVLFQRRLFLRPVDPPVLHTAIIRVRRLCSCLSCRQLLFSPFAHLSSRAGLPMGSSLHLPLSVLRRQAGRLRELKWGRSPVATTPPQMRKGTMLDPITVQVAPKCFSRLPSGTSVAADRSGFHGGRQVCGDFVLVPPSVHPCGPSRPTRDASAERRGLLQF
jgi:hypothetical protein